MMNRSARLFLCVMLLGLCGWADDKVKPTMVDSGSFGIVVNGTRVATETFRVEQRGASSFVISELKLEDPNNKATQAAELEMAANGSLKKYVWKEVKPGEGQIVVQPQDDQFLAVRITENAAAAPKDMVHALSPVTSIMDDNFFSQMQVLAWKYMAAGCRVGANGQNECNWDKRQLPILNPHQHESLLVTMEFTGVQKFKIKGEEHNFKTFKIRGETGEWILWFNEDNKLVRVVIAAENTEVVRD
jgi:hypothetical protein